MRRRRFLFESTRAAAAFGILRSLGACRPQATGAPAGAAASSSANARFVALRDRYFVRHLELNPVTSTYLGGDGYSPQLRDVNGRLRDFSPAALTAERDFYRSVRDELASIPAGSLPPQLAVDHAVLGAQLKFLLHQVEELRYPERAVDTYVAEPFRGVDWQLQQMTEAGGGGLLGSEGEWALVVARLAAVPAYLATARANLAAGKRAGNVPDWRMVERDGIAGSRANAEYFRDTLPRTARGFLGARPFADATLSGLMAAAAGAADAYTAFATFLGQTFDVEEKADRFAIGEREYELRVHEFLRDPRSAQQLYDYGTAQVALYTGKIFAVAESVARDAKLDLRFGSDAERLAAVRRVMEHLSQDSPRSDEELFRWYRETGVRAVAYGRERELLDVPSDYRLDVLETPPVLRSTIDAAYYGAPPFKKSGVGRFYLTPTGNDPGALRQNNRASVADTAIHEGFPGHDWHFKYMTEHADAISNIRWLTPGAVEDSSSMWEDSMAQEGWALYAEELMAEPAPGRPYGFYSAPEYLYELQGQLLRAVRIVVDVGIHTGRMTFDEAVDYFTAHVSFYPGACARAAGDADARAICENARKAIYRYSKWPTQAITYNLGKSAIVDLREAYRARRGAAYSAKEFHQSLMRMGTIPAGYFRETFLRGGE